MNQSQIDPRIPRARIRLLLDEPFFGTLLMNLKVEETKRIPTMSTNGRSLFYNPDFLARLTDDQLVGLLAHEVLHPALLHPFRMGNRDHDMFNRAADYAINNFLDSYNQSLIAAKRTPIFTLKDGMLIDHAYDGLAAEEIYSRLQEKKSESSGGGQKPQDGQGQSQPGQGKPQPGQGPPQPGQGQGQPQPGQGAGKGQPPVQLPDGACSFGEFTKADATDEAGEQELEAEWKIAVKQAALASKGRGKLPAEIERLVQELLDPAAPWQEVLRNFLTAWARDDYSWVRPNRRFAASGLIMPSLHSPHLGRIIVAIDTSGSIGQKQFDAFISEVTSIMFDCRPDALILAQCDARLHSWDEVDLFGGDLQVTFKGGGGTSFCPVFERALEEAEPPAALVYLTDLDGTFPDDQPPFPVLWASINDNRDKVAPWGDTIHL